MKETLTVCRYVFDDRSTCEEDDDDEEDDDVGNNSDLQHCHVVAELHSINQLIF